MRPALPLLATLITLSVAACTQFPELDSTIPPQAAAADFPALVPIGPLLAGAAPVISDRDATTDTLLGRVSALRARAAQLQARPVIDASSRSRLTRAMANAPR